MSVLKRKTYNEQCVSEGILNGLNDSYSRTTINRELVFVLGVEIMSEKSERQWVCTVCGYVHTGDTPPEKCPKCKKPKEVFKEKVSE